MENQKQKGRPPKEKGTAKRDHFSVWVSADQKRQINELIKKSGLSASQYFLTLALDVPLKGHRKGHCLKQPLKSSGRSNNFPAFYHSQF